MQDSSYSGQSCIYIVEMVSVVVAVILIFGFTYCYMCIIQTNLPLRL
jgi:hypothetical protein